MATHQEFQKELQRRGIDENNAYMFTLIFERLIHVAQQVDQCASAVLEMANTMQGFVKLHEQTQQQIKKIRDHDKTEGVEVKSEPIN